MPASASSCRGVRLGGPCAGRVRTAPRPAYRAPCFHLRIHHEVQSQQPFTKSCTAGRSRRGGQPRVDGPPSGPHLTSDVCCVQGGPARSDGPCVRKTANAPVADLCSSDFSSCIFQNCLPVPGSGSGSGMSCGHEACVASAPGTCSPWTSGSSSPWSLCREHHGAPVLAASHSGSVSGSETWTHRMSSHCRSSCEAQHRRACDHLPAPGKCHPPSWRAPSSTHLLLGEADLDGDLE